MKKKIVLGIYVCEKNTAFYKKNKKNYMFPSPTMKRVKLSTLQESILPLSFARADQREHYHYNLGLLIKKLEMLVGKDALNRVAEYLGIEGKNVYTPCYYPDLQCPCPHSISRKDLEALLPSNYVGGGDEFNQNCKICNTSLQYVLQCKYYNNKNAFPFITY